MIELTYARAADADDAVRRAADGPGRYLGGGTNLVDLMRETVETPSALVDVTGLSREIAPTADGGLMIGAAARNTAVAEHEAVRSGYPMLARAIVAGASAQIRNMATVGGNLLQRVQRPAGGKALDRRHLAALVLDCKRQAREHPLAVDEHGAGPASTLIAALLRAV